MKTGCKQAEKRKKEIYDLWLYIAGQTPKSLLAIANLKHICETHLKGRYRIEVVDLMKHPERAQSDQILAIPTVVKRCPDPVRKLFGDMSSAEKVLSGLNLQRRAA